MRRRSYAWTAVGLAAVLHALAAAGASDEASDEDWGDDWNDAGAGVVWSGFAELAGGLRIEGSEPTRATLGELRARAETEWVRGRWSMSFKGDALGDPVLGEAELAVRELAVRTDLGSAVDLKAGRQVLTWGTGDLLFLNDLFPKDFESFFAGREDDYLKAPADAVRVTAYHRAINADLVWMPVFEPDVYLDGSRFSFFNPASGRIEAPDPPIRAERPERTPANGEFALRLFRRIGAGEVAAYGYRGFFKQPTARDESGGLTFAPLHVAGASLRRPWGPGIFHAELAWHRSRDDGAGRDPRGPNSQLRWLVGYERELVTHLTGSVQYYGERVQHHAALRASTPSGTPVPDRWRTVLTGRLTLRAVRDNLQLGAFAFVSPSDRDFHLRPQVSYRLSDRWQVAGGLNLFGGSKDHTFFGQLQDNDNVYVRVRRYY